MRFYEKARFINAGMLGKALKKHGKAITSIETALKKHWKPLTTIELFENYEKKLGLLTPGRESIEKHRQPIKNTEKYRDFAPDFSAEM